MVRICNIFHDPCLESKTGRASIHAACEFIVGLNLRGIMPEYIWTEFGSHPYVVAFVLFFACHMSCAWKCAETILFSVMFRDLPGFQFKLRHADNCLPESQVQSKPVWHKAWDIRRCLPSRCRARCASDPGAGWISVSALLRILGQVGHWCSE